MQACATHFEFTLQVQEGDDFDANVQTTFLQLYCKVQDTNSHAVIYPWAAGDLLHSNSIFNPLLDVLLSWYSRWNQYVHQLVWLPHGSNYHRKIHMGLMVPMKYLLHNSQGWLQSINQDMWMSQLQDATDTVCLGWLLYLAEKFECAALHHENLTNHRDQCSTYLLRDWWWPKWCFTPSSKLCTSSSFGN